VEEFHTDFVGGGGRGGVLVRNGLGGDSGIAKPAANPQATASPAGAVGDIHRIGGGRVENLRLKPAESDLDPPGISVLKAGAPADAAEQVKAAFPNAAKLREAARTVGSTTEEAIRGAGFDVVRDPTRKFPNHHRMIHPQGVAGFVDEDLARLSEAFTDTVLGEE